MIYLTLLKTFLWDNKIVRYGLLSLLLLLTLWFSYKSFYNIVLKDRSHRQPLG